MAKEILDDFGSSGIYQIRNTETNKCYIGSAKCFRIRFGQHRNKLRKSAHHSPHLQRAWNKHGAEKFVFEILEVCEQSELLAREQFWLDSARPAFNVCPTAGSSLGRKFSQLTKDKIAAKAKGRKCQPRSAEYRAKISAAHKGKEKSKAHMEALQAGRAKQVYTDERRAAVSKSLRDSYADGRRSREKTETHRHNMGRSFAKMTDDDIRQIKALQAQGVTGRELAKRFNSNVGTISRICSGKSYRWVV